MLPLLENLPLKRRKDLYLWVLHGVNAALTAVPFLTFLTDKMEGGDWLLIKLHALAVGLLHPLSGLFLINLVIPQEDPLVWRVSGGVLMLFAGALLWWRFFAPFTALPFGPARPDRQGLALLLVGTFLSAPIVRERVEIAMGPMPGGVHLLALGYGAAVFLLGVLEMWLYREVLRLEKEERWANTQEAAQPTRREKPKPKPKSKAGASVGERLGLFKELLGEEFPEEDLKVFAAAAQGLSREEIEKAVSLVRFRATALGEPLTKREVLKALREARG